MIGRLGTKRAIDKDLDGGVRVWYFSLDIDSAGYARCARILNDEERHRARKFRFHKHRRRFIAGRGTLRRILGHYATCDPEGVRFGYGKYGKPSFAGPSSVGDLTFNVSNSGGLGAVAVARCIELGLDLERIRSSDDHELIALREFSVDEKNWFLGLPEAERTTGFFDLWTCKEAYLKGKGLGLNGSLNQFSISQDSDMPPRLRWSGIDGVDPQRWRFHRLAIQPGFVACLALDGECGAIRAGLWRLPA